MILKWGYDQVLIVYLKLVDKFFGMLIMCTLHGIVEGIKIAEPACAVLSG